MYLLDANVFIQAKNAHYAFDFCPAFWDWIDQAHRNGRVFSIQKVKDELLAGKDELTEWAKSRPEEFFLAPDQFSVRSLQSAANWATSLSSHYTSSAISTFLSSADFYLVSQAHEKGFTVVTHEMFEPNAKRVVKIPNACKGMDVPFLSLSSLLRLEGARFILDTSVLQQGSLS